MTKTRFLALLSVLALLAAMPLASVFAQQPVPPQKFYGTVIVNGEAPPEGSTVMATVTTMMTNEEGEEVTETMTIGEGQDRCHGQLRAGDRRGQHARRKGSHVPGHGHGHGRVPRTPCPP